MTDLISRQAAIKALRRKLDINAKGEVGGFYNTIIRNNIECIERLRSVDAVPVVRCKDCRWKEEEQPGMVYCPATVGGWVDEEWFCKGGERSEE